LGVWEREEKREHERGWEMNPKSTSKPVEQTLYSATVPIKKRRAHDRGREMSSCARHLTRC